MRVGKRLAIYAIYDPEGKIDTYVEYAASSLKEIADRVVLVINGVIQTDCFHRLLAITKDIYIRENKGYDGGAYKDVILNYLKWNPSNAWDELILMNDTFYGPFESWVKCFSFMDKYDCDFWGLSSYNSKYTEICEAQYKWRKHIQGYFLVFRRTVLEAPCFYYFWNSLLYPNDYFQCIRDFEIGINDFLVERGFSGLSYLNLIAPKYQQKENESVYLSYADELVREYHFPVLKYKALSPLYLKENRFVVQYIEENTDYDTTYIKEHQLRLENESRLRPFSMKDLERFYNKHARIMIYGHGTVAFRLTNLFDIKDWTFENYIVTKKKEEEKNDQGIVEFHELNIDRNTGIIVALGRQATEEVQDSLKDVLDSSQLFFFDYTN